MHFQNGIPIDQATDSRFSNNLAYWLSWFLTGRSERQLVSVLKDRFNYKESGVCPQ